METTELVVIVAGISLVGLVLWYFFGARKAVAAQIDQSGVQEVKITVRGGYSPDVVVARLGKPLRLDFYRDEQDSCSEQVVFSDFGIARSLPAFSTTSIEFTPKKAGEFVFTCGMRMLRGKLIVK